MRRNSVQTSGLASEIVKRIRVAAGISRADLARDLGLSGSTAGVYVDRLMASGFLTEAQAPGTGDAGRPPKLLHLNPHGGEFIGIDFEARNIMAVAIDFAERPLRRAHEAIDEGDPVERILLKIERAVRQVMPPDAARLLAIGAGAPGLVDPATGVALRYEHLPQWRDVPVAGRLRQRFGVPVYLENTMRAMALAELWFGHGRQCSDFVCLCIRSGMGAGIVSNGQLQRGGHRTAGELGRCRCPALSPDLAALFPAARAEGPELQDVVAIGPLQAALRRHLKPPTLERIAAALRAGDPLTRQVVDQVVATLGGALANLVLTVDPVKIVLAGQLTPLGDLFLEPLRRSVAQALSASGFEAPPILNSSLGEHIGALGAAALALHEWRPTRQEA